MRVGTAATILFASTIALGGGSGSVVCAGGPFDRSDHAVEFADHSIVSDPVQRSVPDVNQPDDDITRPLFAGEAYPITMDQVVAMTLSQCPQIASLRAEAAVETQRIIIADAAFDWRYFSNAGLGRTNDPVGNTLVTGGPSRLNERNVDFSGGLRRTTRGGNSFEMSQGIGLLNSNSQFFAPTDQGNSRMSVSMTHPLMRGRGHAYNRRLIVQATLKSESVQGQTTSGIANRLASVMTRYARLCEARSHVWRQRDLIDRSDDLHDILRNRQSWDVSPLELNKLRSRGQIRADRLIGETARVRRTQASLRGLIGGDPSGKGADALHETAAVWIGHGVDAVGSGFDAEWLPQPVSPPSDPTPRLAEAMSAAARHNGDIAAAIAEVELAAAEIRVSRHELKPQLDAVFAGYLAGLNGNNRVLDSFGDQFAGQWPGFSGGLNFEMPRHRRGAHAKHRIATLRYQQSTARLRETVAQVQQQVQTALVAIDAARQQMHCRGESLAASMAEESALRERFELMGTEGGMAGIVLEAILDAQSRTTEAAKSLVTAQTELRVGWIELERVCGTLVLEQPTLSGFSGHWIGTTESDDVGGDYDRYGNFQPHHSEQAVASELTIEPFVIHPGMMESPVIDAVTPSTSNPEPDGAGR